MIAFAPQPVPFIICVTTLAIGFTVAITLPDPAQLVNNPKLFQNMSLIAAYEYTYIGENPNVPDTSLNQRSLIIREWDRQIDSKISEWTKIR
jgi:hypothetical protein